MVRKIANNEEAIHLIWYANEGRFEGEKEPISFLNFLSTTLERPIYKGVGTCGRKTEIFIYDDEYGKSTNIIHDIQAMAVATLGEPSNHSDATAWLRI